MLPSSGKLNRIKSQYICLPWRIAQAQGVNLVADRKYFGLTGRFSHQGQDVRLLELWKTLEKASRSLSV